MKSNISIKMMWFVSIFSLLFAVGCLQKAPQICTVDPETEEQTCVDATPAPTPSPQVCEIDPDTGEEINCVWASPTPVPTPDPELFRIDETWGDFRKIIVDMKLARTDISVKLRLQVPDEIIGKMNSQLSYGSFYEFTDVDPDVIIRMNPTAWDASAVEGFAPAITRYGDLTSEYFLDHPDVGTRSTRELLIANRWADRFPEFFPAAPIESNTRIAVLGHLRGFIEFHPEMYERMAEAVNLQNPEYVVMLGDMVKYGIQVEWAILRDKFISKLNVDPTKVIFVPGNHEAHPLYQLGEIHMDRFEAEFGAVPPVVITDHVNLVMLGAEWTTPDNTIEGVDAYLNGTEAGNFLDGAFDQVDPTKPTWLMTHNKVFKYVSGRYFQPADIIPLVEGKVDAIIAGDATKAEIKYGEKVYVDAAPITEGYTVNTYEVGIGDLDQSGSTWPLGHPELSGGAPVFFGMFSIAEGDTIPKIQEIYIDFERFNFFYANPHIANVGGTVEHFDCLFKPWWYEVEGGFEVEEGVEPIDSFSLLPYLKGCEHSPTPGFWLADPDWWLPFVTTELQ